MALDGVDPNIALQAGRGLPAFGPNWDAVANAQRAAISMQQSGQVQQAQNALKMLYANPTNFDQKTMQPTPQAMTALMGTSPAAGMDLMNNLVTLQEKRARTNNLQSESMKEWQQKGLDVGKAALDTYRAALEQGAAPQAAIQRGQEVYTTGLDALKESGLPDQLKAIASPTFDPIRIEKNLMTVAQQKAAENLKKDGYQLVTQSNAAGQPQQVWAAPSKPTLDMAGNPITPTGMPKVERTEEDPYMVKVPKPEGGGTQEVLARRGPGGRGFVSDETGEKLSGVVSARKVSTKATPDADDANVATTAKAIASYQQAPLSGYALRAPGAQAVMAKVLELNPNYQATRYPEVAKAMRDFGTGTQGNTTRSLNVAVDHLDSLSELAAALKNGDISVVNRLSNLLKTELGLSSAPNTFEAARSIVGAEVTKAVVGGVTALGDREEARKPIDAARSPEQLADVVAEYKRLMAGQLKGLERQYQDATGFGADTEFSFRKKLDPRTIKEMEGAHTPGSKPNEAAIPPKPAVGSAAVPEMTREQYDAAPSGAAYRVPGNPAVMYKP